MSDDARNGRISRRDALKKTAAVGGVLWIVPAVQTVNMSKAWAAVGSELPPDESGGEGGPGPGPGPSLGDRYTVRFDIGRGRATCLRPSGNSCRCLSAESRAGGCSFARAVKTGSHGQWTVTIAGEGARVLEGFAVCGVRRGRRCDPGSTTSTNAMAFRTHHPHGRRQGRRHSIAHIEVTFLVPRQGA